MNKDIKDLLQFTLKRQGFSLTKPRELVFDLLLNKEPQTMNEIHKRIDRRIDRASLYRIINVFEQSGVVQRLPVGWKYKIELTDLFTHHHHHITCIGCAKIFPIKEDASIEKLISELAIKYKVVSTGHQLEVQGYCENCAKTNISLIFKQ